MDDWEDNLYDYGSFGGNDVYDDVEDEDRERRDEESFGKDPDEEEDPFRGESAMEDDDMDFKPDFKQMQQLVGDKGRGTTLAPGASKRAQKAMRSAEDIITDQLRGILSSDSYSDMSENKKSSIVTTAETFKNVSLLHLETLIQALIWKMENKILDKKNFTFFVKKYNITDQISLLSYIRLVLSNSK